jgi:hypothetical protein
MPEIEPEPSGPLDRFLVGLFVAIPLLAVLAAIPLAWNLGWLGWHDVVIALVFYVISGMGISMGFHRYFTHSSFKANRGLKNALAVAGTLAIEGPVLVWVADHRRHHKYSDKEGDPHSPWRFGEDWKALTKGMGWAHMGWLFDRSVNSQVVLPDLLADKDVVASRGGSRIVAFAISPRAHRRTVVDVHRGRSPRSSASLSGSPLHHVTVDQLGLPHSATRTRGARQVPQRRLAGHPVVR